MTTVDAADPPAAVHLDQYPAAARDGEDADEQLTRLITENLRLRAKLSTLPVIEQAKGVLIGRYAVDADTAFALLCHWSSTTNVKLREVSRWLVDAAGDEAPALEQTLAGLENHPAVIARRAR